MERRKVLFDMVRIIAKNTELIRAQLVTAIEYGGEKLTKRVVADIRKDRCSVTEQEFRSASEENR
jgi:hypothetical protein